MAWFGQYLGTTYTGQWWGDSGIAPVAEPTGGSAKRKPFRPRPKRHYVEIDGQYFEVRDRRAAEEVLAKLREAAEEIAPKAVKKAARKGKPVELPKVAVVNPDYSSDFVQQLQAQVDAANAALVRIYETARLAMLAAEAMQRDDEEIAVLITMGVL